MSYSTLLFRHIQFALLLFGGQTKKFRSPDGLLGTVCVQDSAKFNQNFSWGPKEQLVTTKIPTSLSCVHAACVLDPLDDACGMTGRWLLQTVPWDVFHDSQDRIYNAIKVTCYQVAHADPLPASLAILPRAPSLCHKQALLQLESRVYFCKP